MYDELAYQATTLCVPSSNPRIVVSSKTQVQTDSESSSPDDVELNSATEISTDSEFDQDPVIREAPRIFIDDTHLKKPTKVQVKQGVIGNNQHQKATTASNQYQSAINKPEIEFKPLVQVDQSILNSNRIPLKNPRPGDYMLNKTPSTEGIASKKSLELKKRYLLGEQGIGIGIMKSGSTSILDSKFKNFHSNISECQKLLNPASDISPTMKKFLDRTKSNENGINRISSECEVTKNSDEKENVYVNGQNELNKGMEYSETINTALVESKTKEISQKNLPSPIIETIDLISPEKIVPIIDLAQVDIPSAMVKTNQDFIENLKMEDDKPKESIFIDLTLDTPVKKLKESSEEELNITPIEEKADVVKDVKETIPDIITEIEKVIVDKTSNDSTSNINQIQSLEEDEEALIKDNDIQETSIQVPNIPWNKKKNNKNDVASDSSSSSTSSLEDIPHYILDSTTSPDTQNGLEQIVPRLEVHDTSGTLMQIDSLMIIDGKYIGDPDDLKHMEIPPGTKVELPITEEQLPDKLMSNTKKPDLKFDTKNENKVDTLRNLPLTLDKVEKEKSVKPTRLNLIQEQKQDLLTDKDKTPTAEQSESETEVTGQVLTETELSDWTADDAVSENFVDIEFVLNSNKGTIKRNKKSKKKIISPKGKKHKSIEKLCGILKNLDIEEIEFMDTGSEGSCAEAVSATNKAMLQNRGYIQFIENTHNSHAIPNNSYSRYGPAQSQNKQFSENKEIPGIDYIEQGACILNNEIDLKTPVNELPPFFLSKLGNNNSHATQLPPPQQMDSLNDMDDDSLLLITSQGTVTTATTTEESDALTVVTSPLDTLPRNKDTPTTPSSSDKNDKTISDSGASKIPVRKISHDESRKRLSQESILNSLSNKRKDSEELSYEEYVRKLQMKITQISNARDSIDIRKQKRKTSKGDISENSSVIENKSLSIFDPVNTTATSTADNNQPAGQQNQQITQIIPEVPGVSKKLEEITKERTKQKDLIHDLVMDKLQLKKQLNAEKRLNRSRNRNLFNAGGGAGGCLSSTPKMTSNICSNSPHYHEASSERRNSKPINNENKENSSKLSKTIIKSSPKDNKDIVQLFASPPAAARTSKERPLSDNIETTVYHNALDQAPKITKTQSFCCYNTRDLSRKHDPLGLPPLQSSALKSVNSFVTPVPPPRTNKKMEDTPAVTTDKLRAEARARARLKSNHELGLSPEEKLEILRKRYNLDLNEATTTCCGSGGSHNKQISNQSDDMKVRERKMMTSKSVNDISAVQNLLNSDENFNSKPPLTVSDFTSDPNLTESQQNHHQKNRRRKDPDRRKSLIQTVSNFFHKKKDTKDSPSPPSKEKQEGVFSRFRISPKTKEKSKSCFDVRNNGFGDKEGSPYERSKSQDCLKCEVSSYSSSPQLFKSSDEVTPPPIPPLPINYQRSDDESYATETREQKKQRAISKASRQAELKRLRIAQEIQREQEEIEVKLKDLEARGVLIEKALRGEGQNIENLETSSMGANDEKLLKALLEIWRNITQLKKRDEELGIRQQELQLEHRHAQLKEELNTRLSSCKLDKSSADVAAEGAILNEMLEIVAKRAALRPNETTTTTVARQSNEIDSDM